MVLDKDPMCAGTYVWDSFVAVSASHSDGLQLRIYVTI